MFGVTSLFILGMVRALGTYLPAEMWADPGSRALPLGGAYLSIVAALGVGWVLGFPRWFYLYPGLLTTGAVLGLWRVTIEWGSLSGVLLSGLLGIAVAIVLGLLVLTRSLTRLLTAMRRDWTLLSCAVYGLAPLVQSLVFDDAHTNSQTAFLFLSTMGMVSAAALYLRGGNTGQRAVTLLSGMTIVLLMGALDKAHFAGGLGPWLGQPSTWRQELPWFANLWGLLAGAMLAPALLGHVPGAARPRQTGVTDAPR
jgi:hypothetical protein